MCGLCLQTKKVKIMSYEKVFIIAEAGVNHNGSLETARKMIDAASEAGVDAVKFQTFRAENIASANAPKAYYQKNTTCEDESQLEMLKKLELDEDAHKDLKVYCEKKDVMFLSTPFDLESVDMLEDMGLALFKVPSGEITNLPYLRKIGALRKKIILSSGMSNLDEIEDAIMVLVAAGTRKEDITVLQCNTEYPTPYEDVNLRAMSTIRESFGVDVGYSDHTLGIDIVSAAVGLGASVIEKHFTLDRQMEGPDHAASLEPEQLRRMVEVIRNTELAMGDGIKKPSSSEFKNITAVRKSIVAACPIAVDEVFTEDNLTVKRPATGISPVEWDNVLGKSAKRDFGRDEAIEL